MVIALFLLYNDELGFADDKVYTLEIQLNLLLLNSEILIIKKQE